MCDMPAVCLMQACAALFDSKCGAGLCSARWHGAAWRLYKAECQRGDALRYATYQMLISFAFQACLCLQHTSDEWQAVAEERRAGCAQGALPLSAVRITCFMPDSKLWSCLDLAGSGRHRL